MAQGSQVIWVTLGVIGVVFGHEVIMSSYWTPTNYFRTLVFMARQVFFLKPTVLNATHYRAPELSEFTTTEKICGALQLLLQYAYQMQRVFIVGALGMSAITIWVAASNFAKIAHSEDDGQLSRPRSRNTQSLAEVMEAFREVKRLADSINAVWLPVFVWFILDSLTWWAVDLDFIIRTNDWTGRTYSGYLLIYLATSVILSAESYRKVVKRICKYK